MIFPEATAGLAAVLLLALAANLGFRARAGAVADRRRDGALALGLCAGGLAAAASLLAWLLPVAAVAAVAAAALWPWRQRAPGRDEAAERLRALELSDWRFREALSRSSITVFAQDTQLRYTWVHNPHTRISEIVTGTSTSSLAYGADDADELKRRAMETGQTVNDTVAIPTESEGRLYFDMTVTPTLDAAGRVDGVLCSAFDVTEMRLFEVRLTAMAAQLAAAYQRFELALDNSPITVFEQGTDLRYTFVYNPPPGLGVEAFLERTDREVYPERDAQRLASVKERVLAEGNRETVELEIEVAGVMRYYDLTLEPKRDSEGTVVGIIGTSLDLTERRRDEKRIRLMLRELTHRSKNLLAVIQAMARKTASLSGDLDGFISDFSLRLRAIAAAHDLLVSHSWHGADLRELLRASLAPTIDPDSPQVILEGPPLMLTPDAAQNLGLAFHELATNASKYGALSVQAGVLHVGWERLPAGGRILWQERHGPRVNVPERHGFGWVLLERLVGTTLNGSVSLKFEPEGLVCEINFPDEGLIARSTPATEASLEAAGGSGGVAQP